MTPRFAKTLLAALLGIGCVQGANAQQAAGMFGEGRLHGAVIAGYGSAFNEDYAIFGLGINYYLIDGLAIGGNFETWRGGDPSITKLTLSTQYVFYQVPTIKPYIGAFYRRTYITNLDDLNSYGARAGAYLQLGRNAYFGLGGVYEQYADCTESRYRSCSDTYPEITLTFAF
jgi:hypothetical protein